MEEYAYAKRQIFRNQTEDDYAVLNASASSAGCDGAGNHLQRHGKGWQIINSSTDGWWRTVEQVLVEQSRTHLIGEHNAENMLAALGRGRSLRDSARGLDRGVVRL